MNMPVDKIVRFSRFSTLIISISFLFTFLTLLWMGSYEFNTIKERQHILTDSKITDIHGHLLALEKETENAIRMAIITGDKKWQEQYEKDSATLVNLVKEANVLASADHQSSVWVKSDWSMDDLNQLRTNAFHLYQTGNADAARQLLFGSQYDQSQNRHLAAINAFDQSLVMERHEHLQNKINKTHYNVTILFITFLFLMLALFAIYSQHKEALSDEIDQAFMIEVERALANNEFILHYQPIVHASDGRIMGAEALVRWQHPDHGLLSPDSFIKQCELNGCIIPLGKWILSAACKQIKQWHDSGHTHLSMSVNLSARQLKHPELLKLVDEMLTSHQINPKHIKLEITESLMMENVDSNVSLLKGLRKLGLQLSLDDFGTGYSSLSYLKQFPFNYLKIDKSFISDIATNSVSVAIVKAIITLGKNLGLTLIAEGIEHETQWQILQNMQCDLLQGYLYSKPVTAQHFTQLLTNTAYNNKTC